MARIVDKDKGLKKVIKILEDKLQVNVIINSNDPEVEKRALIHEFTERSFIRGYVDDNQQKIKRKMKELAVKSVKKRQPITVEAQKFAGITEKGIKKRIDKGISPPLKEETVKQKERKGSRRPTTPLYDTGDMYNSIEAVVERLNK